MTVLAILALAWSLADPARPGLRGPGRGGSGNCFASSGKQTPPPPRNPAPDSPQRASPRRPRRPPPMPSTRPTSLRNDAWLHNVCFVDAPVRLGRRRPRTIWHTATAATIGNCRNRASPARSARSLSRRPGRLGRRRLLPSLSAHQFRRAAGHRDGGRHWYRDRRPPAAGVETHPLLDPEHGWRPATARPCFPAAFPAAATAGEAGAAPPAATPPAGRPATFSTAQRPSGRTQRSMAAVRQGHSRGRAGRPTWKPSGNSPPPPPYAWLVGDGGRLWSVRPGRSSAGAVRAFPATSAALFDFAALAVRGRRAGSPRTTGSRLLHSADGGRTWSVFAAPTRLPLSAIRLSRTATVGRSARARSLPAPTAAAGDARRCRAAPGRPAGNGRTMKTTCRWNCWPGWRATRAT